MPLTRLFSAKVEVLIDTLSGALIPSRSCGGGEAIEAEGGVALLEEADAFEARESLGGICAAAVLDDDVAGGREKMRFVEEVEGAFVFFGAVVGRIEKD